MKQIIITIGIALSLSFCKNTAQTGVIIKTNNDTLRSGELYVAELYVQYNQSILPTFFLTLDNDTIGLEIDTVKKCGIFRSLLTTEGDKVFNGYVEYIDLKGNQKIEKFSLKYYVKPK